MPSLRVFLTLGVLLALPAGCTAVPAPPTPSGPPEVTAENLLQNPGFEQNWFSQAFAARRRFLLLQSTDIGMAEQDGHIDYWEVKGKKPVEIWDADSPAHGGSRSVRFTAPGSMLQRVRWAGENYWLSGGASYSQFLPLWEGLAEQLHPRSLVASAWCRCEGADSPPTLTVEALCLVRPGADDRKAGKEISFKKSVPFPAGTHDWEQASLRLDPAELPGTPHFLLVSLSYPGKQGKVWFDDASLNDLPTEGEKNVLEGGSFEDGGVDFPSHWSRPQLWTWFRNNYYTGTGWTHQASKTFRGGAWLDSLVRYQGGRSLRFDVFPGDNFAVCSDPIYLSQNRAKPLEVRAMVRADNLRNLEIMAQDDRGQWLAQGDFLGDDMENNPGLYNMGTTGSGTYDWTCVRKLFSPRQPLKSVRLFLCARGFDGRRVEKNLVGTVWWDNVALIEHGTGSSAGVALERKPAEPLRLDLGDRLFGTNEMRLSGRALDGGKVLLTVLGPDGKSRETSAPVTAGQACVPYEVGPLCRDSSQQYSATLTWQNGSRKLTSRYSFGTPSRLLEVGSERVFLNRGEATTAYVRLNASPLACKSFSRLVLVARHGDQERVVAETRDFPRPWKPQPMPEYTDVSRALTGRLDLGSEPVHPWQEPTLDCRLVARLYGSDGKLVSEQEGPAFGVMEPIPTAALPATIGRTSVNARNYLEIDGRPYFPVYWTPDFGRAGDGNFPPRLYGATTVDLSRVKPQDQEKEIQAGRQAPNFFGLVAGGGEMQLQGPTWMVRLQEWKQVVARLHEEDPLHVVMGSESWLVGHPGHDEAMGKFVDSFDIVGVETSFEEVPNPRKYAVPFQAGHPCAVLAGLEAYYYQAPEVLRWRGYRSVAQGCAGVGLCPSQMLRAIPARVNFLRGLNGEFRGLGDVFVAAEPSPSAQVSGPVESFERVHAGRRYVFVTATSQARPGSPVVVRVPGLRSGASVQVRCENRSLRAQEGEFRDSIDPYGVHVYVIESST